MFSKPNLFPKANEPQPARGARLVPGGAVGAAPAVPGEAGASAREAAATSAGSSSLSAGQTVGSATEDEEVAGESRLIVGPHVKLKGAEILDCDTLVVEGRVDATMDSRVIRIAEKGAFSGKVGIDVAEVHGQFDGELTARHQLIIHATGRVSGKIRYGKIFIEEGGEISGDVRALDSAASSGARKDDSAASTTASPVRAVEPAVN